MSITVETHVDRFFVGRWDSCSKDVFTYGCRSGANHGSANSLKGSAPGLPAKHVSQQSGGSHEARDVFRDIERLDSILRILAVCNAPTAQFNVKLTTNVIGSKAISCIQV